VQVFLVTYTVPVVIGLMQVILKLTSMLCQSSDRTACIWDSRSGQCVMRFEGHEGEVNSVRFFPTGEAIGTACNDGTVSSVHM
jgi:WD40 repeat protein